MNQINYLTSVAKIAMLYKSRYETSSFQKIHDKIKSLDPTNDILPILDKVINPPVVAALPTKTTTETKPANTQLKIEYKSPTPVAKSVWFDPPRNQEATDFENFKKWTTECNLSDEDEVILYTKFKGFTFKFEVSPTSRIMYIKDKYGNVLDVSSAACLTELNDVKFDTGNYYGVITPRLHYWEDSGVLKELESNGIKVHKSPINALYNALLRPDVEESKMVLKSSECFITRIPNEVFSCGSISSHLEKNKNLENYVIPFETYKVSDVTEELMAAIYADCSECNFIDGITVEINKYSKQSKLVIDKRPVCFSLCNLVPDDNIRTVIINQVEYQLSRFGEVIPILYFDKENYYNHSINKIILPDSKMINEYEIGDQSVIELCISENSFGELSTEVLGVIAGTPDFEKLTKCPKCGNTLKQTKDGLYCINDVECTALKDKRIASFFNLMGYTRFNTVLASKFRSGGFTTPYQICSCKYEQMLAVCKDFTPSEISKLYALCQQLIHQGAELNRLQTASSCFEGIPTSTLKSLQLRIMHDVVNAAVKDKSSDELIDMVDEWESWLDVNPFKIK